MDEQTLDEMIVGLVGACSAPIDRDDLKRLIRWATDVRQDVALLRLALAGTIEIVVGEDGMLPPNRDDWCWRERKL